MDTWESDVHTPLLHTVTLRGRINSCSAFSESVGSRNKQAQATDGALQAGADSLFLRRLLRLFTLSKPWPALFLVALSLLEAFIVSRVGTITGAFYRILVDKQHELFWRAMAMACGLYLLSTLVMATTQWLSELIALRMRDMITCELQAKYCTAANFYKSNSDIDNPDQRITQDVAGLCSCLADILKVFAAAPLKLVFYSIWMYSYTSWPSVLLVYAFFGVGTAVQRLVMTPVARATFRLEQAEGDLRFAHLRLRQWGEEVATYGGSAVELQQLERRLVATLSRQGRIVTLHWLLAATTQALEYAGALLNYFCVGVAVFTGAIGRGGDGGQIAQAVSNASFATLMLIYSFTQMLDVSNRVSALAGFTTRVCQLLEALQVQTSCDKHDVIEDPSPKPQSWRSVQSANHDAVLAVEDVSEPGLDGWQLVQSELSQVVVPPAMVQLAHGRLLQHSTHALGPDLQALLRHIFPDAPPHPLLAVMTFQFSDVDLAPDQGSASHAQVGAEMDRMLDSFVGWQSALAALLRARSFWCNAVDPHSGYALSGRRGERWSEVAAARTLLAYPTRNAGPCPVVIHPNHGSSCYPATLFTDAPPAVLQEAISSLHSRSDQWPQWPSSATTPDSDRATVVSSEVAPTLLQLSGVTYRTAGGRLVARDLSFTLRQGGWLLVAGPSGCGKTTLLRALCGIHPLDSGTVVLPPSSEVMFLPQRPVAAPGSSLRQQLTYPDSQDRSPASRLAAILEAVGLAYLLKRVANDWDAAADWASMLSPGELQRLSIGRVLHRRPRLAVLDEPCSAVGADVEAELYLQLRSAAVTVVTLGQQTPLVPAHGTLLTLTGDGSGTWEVSNRPEAA